MTFVPVPKAAEASNTQLEADAAWKYITLTDDAIQKALTAVSYKTNYARAVTDRLCLYNINSIRTRVESGLTTYLASVDGCASSQVMQGGICDIYYCTPYTYELQLTQKAMGSKDYAVQSIYKAVNQPKSPDDIRSGWSNLPVPPEMEIPPAAEMPPPAAEIPPEVPMPPEFVIPEGSSSGLGYMPFVGDVFGQVGPAVEQKPPAVEQKSPVVEQNPLVVQHQDPDVGDSDNGISWDNEAWTWSSTGSDDGVDGGAFKTCRCFDDATGQVMDEWKEDVQTPELISETDTYGYNPTFGDTMMKNPTEAGEWNYANTMPQEPKVSGGWGAPNTIEEGPAPNGQWGTLDTTQESPMTNEEWGVPRDQAVSHDARFATHTPQEPLINGEPVVPQPISLRADAEMQSDTTTLGLPAVAVIVGVVAVTMFVLGVFTGRFYARAEADKRAANQEYTPLCGSPKDTNVTIAVPSAGNNAADAKPAFEKDIS
ncbi:unnamed protein product [Phytophthora fragariaefolia]|uniref:Unnamed protein product n=1 Tax=Phytophthora fragariaefolia TaxID=1490495 RepID=A0A9W6Y7A2_9STRA|nr:unnamed protein product [Phytophthora fragariaefolia]